MMDQKPLKIEIPVEEEAPLTAERPRPDVGQSARAAGEKLARATESAARQAWESAARRKATQKLGEITDKGVRAVGTRVAETAEQQTRQRATAVQERLRTTDWRQATKQGAVQGLRWLSRRLEQLAQRLTPTEKQPPQP
jgi:hypothetical protein